MDASEVKKLLKSENLIIGSDRVLKLLRAGQVDRVMLANNAPKAIAEDVLRYASLKGAQADLVEVPNDELGVLCKKPFSISVIGLKKAQSAPKKH